VNEHKATNAKALARRRNHISIFIKGTRMTLHAQRLPHSTVRGLEASVALGCTREPSGR